MTELTREVFMRNTKVFVTHLYFEGIQRQFNESHLNVSDFISAWENENEPLIQEAIDNSNFRFMLDDSSLLDNTAKPNWDKAYMITVIDNLSAECAILKNQLDIVNEFNARMHQHLKSSTSLMKNLSEQFLLAKAPASSILQ